jgi:hypothetical protein
LKFHEKILLAVFAGILAFVTMVGNLLVMISFGLNKKLRIINNYFLASLSIADFSIGLISMPLYAVYMPAAVTNTNIKNPSLSLTVGNLVYFPTSCIDLGVSYFNANGCIPSGSLAIISVNPFQNY